jgi:LysM repeat protein
MAGFLTDPLTEKPGHAPVSSPTGMGAFRHSSLRALAPASLVLFAIVLLIVVVTSLAGGGDSSSSPSSRPTLTETHKRSTARERAARRARRAAKRGVYIVQTGDTLYTIASRTGIPIETLRALNPTADPQGLVAGQRIRLPVAGERGATGASGASGTSGASGVR